MPLILYLLLLEVLGENNPKASVNDYSRVIKITPTFLEIKNIEARLGYGIKRLDPTKANDEDKIIFQKPF